MPQFRPHIRNLILCLFFALPAFAQSQTTTAQAVKHPETVNVLTRCVAAAGGSQAINSIQGFHSDRQRNNCFASNEVNTR